MSRKTALEAVTINNAKMMDIDDRTGTLTPGKDADFIVLSGDPLSVYTTIEQTWIEGNQVYDHTNPEHNKFMTGGMDVFRGDIVHTHHDH
jgi:imidazolonepropionase-like amidohydrolase